MKYRSWAHARDLRYSINIPGHKCKNFHKSVHYRIIRKDGVETIINFQGELIFDQHDNPIKVFGTNHDITEQKRVEKELRNAKEEAEEAIKIKDKFVSLVSHNLRNPLSTITGFLELLKKEYGC